jgi:hypothetical protein
VSRRSAPLPSACFGNAVMLAAACECCWCSACADNHMLALDIVKAKLFPAWTLAAHHYTLYILCTEAKIQQNLGVHRLACLKYSVVGMGSTNKSCKLSTGSMSCTARLHQSSLSQQVSASVQAAARAAAAAEQYLVMQQRSVTADVINRHMICLLVRRHT